MSDIYLTYATIDEAAAALETVRTELLTLIAGVQTDVTSLGAAFATESASGAFEALVSNFTAQVTKAFTGLESFSQILNATVSTFSEADSAMANAAQNLEV